jgi:PadR family transcriptional regulator PadR
VEKIKIDKSLLAGSTSLLILKLLEGSDMYGYQMIETLSARSEKVFELKAGTLYPLLHTLEQKGLVDAYEKEEAARVRRYYSLTRKGKHYLHEKEAEWREYASAVNRVLGGFRNAEGV